MNLIDLPVEVIQEVFKHLPNKDVYFNVRKVCRALQDIVDGYIELGMYFQKEQIPTD